MSVLLLKEHPPSRKIPCNPKLCNPGLQDLLEDFLRLHPLVPGCHAFLILHGIAEAFGLNAEVA
jgi:hypothetical protein